MPQMPIDRAIDLLRSYKITNNRMTLLEARHYIDKLLDAEMAEERKRSLKTVRCVDCGWHFESKQANKQRCHPCEVEYKRKYNADRRERGLRR